MTSCVLSCMKLHGGPPTRIPHRLLLFGSFRARPWPENGIWCGHRHVSIYMILLCNFHSRRHRALLARHAPSTSASSFAQAMLE
jgi:hypothetical protein